MATKLDRKWVQGIKDSINEDVEALAAEIERLEALQAKKDAALTNLMNAYERLVRSQCVTEAALLLKPWECWEYCAAREALR